MPELIFSVDITQCPDVSCDVSRYSLVTIQPLPSVSMFALPSFKRSAVGTGAGRDKNLVTLDGT
jgi:hypothetical protein